MDCLLCGVGGQGTVLASRVLAQTAMESGQFARTAETIGMAQRGGCVVSHVRVGSTASPMIPLGGADVLIGFEPGEAVRCLPYLKPDGVVVVNAQAVQPVTASLTGKRLDADAMIDYLRSKVRRVLVVDGEAVCAACGTPKVLNTALLGAAIASGALGMAARQVERVLLARLPQKVHEVNQKALALGARAAKGE